MSEEEIQKIKCIHLADYKASDKLCPAIEELKKEKEKNKELNKLKGFEMLDIFNMGKESSRQRIKHDWVEKEKVRQKLEEEQKRIKNSCGKFYNDKLGNSATKILQELLEEE